MLLVLPLALLLDLLLVDTALAAAGALLELGVDAGAADAEAIVGAAGAETKDPQGLGGGGAVDADLTAQRGLVADVLEGVVGHEVLVGAEGDDLGDAGDGVREAEGAAARQ